MLPSSSAQRHLIFWKRQHPSHHAAGTERAFDFNLKSSKLNTVLTKGTSDYNKLSKEIRNIKTVSNFKTKLYEKFKDDEEKNIM